MAAALLGLPAVSPELLVALELLVLLELLGEGELEDVASAGVGALLEGVLLEGVLGGAAELEEALAPPPPQPVRISRSTRPTRSRPPR